MTDSKKIVIYSGTIVSFLILVSIIIYLYQKIQSTSNRAPIIITENERRISSPPIPDSLEFCGEKVPTEDFDVYERIDREFLVNTYWHSATLLYFKRANRWFPIIEPILKANGIPDDFKYMSVAESGLTNAVSTQEAVGFWQMLAPVAEKYNLEINDEVDERYYVEKETQAACDYLKEAYSKFNNWTLAAASYNYGINGIENTFQREKTKNYYNMYLNEETYRFVARIIAIKEIFKNPHKYGFYFSEGDLYKTLETYNIEINYSINDLADFSKKYGIDYKIIKLFNPWLRQNFLKNKAHKTYYIKIPKSGTIKFSND
jgi:hypothetical protein